MARYATGSQEGGDGLRGAATGERAFLLASANRSAPWSVEESLDELAELATSAGAQVVGRLFQRLDAPDPRTYLGRGKLEEARREALAREADLIIVDDELTPGTQRAVEEAIGRRVVDRTLLILDIFAQRARTREGRVQVQLAQLQYLLPRLSRAWLHLERQGGGIGLRAGPGETQIEIDRRLIRARISALAREIEGIRLHRSGQRVFRQRSGTPVVALVGYTNAGKSTLFNQLTRASAVAEDKVFATLDPLTRRVQLPGGLEVLVSDTVGFIAKLPASLVAAFRATLEELQTADLLLHIVDITSPRAAERAEVVQQVLEEVGAGDRPSLAVLNKADLLVDQAQELHATLPEARAADSVVVSAARGWNIEELLQRAEAMLERDYRRLDVQIPYAQAALVDLFHRKGTVATEKHTSLGTVISGALPARFALRFEPYVVSRNGRPREAL